ncbi:MAG: acyltransferase [Pseudomonadota bacterium]
MLQTKSYKPEQNENSWERYRRLVSGQNRIGRFFMEELLLSIFGPIPGLTGIVLRRLIYPCIIKSHGAINIDRSVTFRCPSKIALGRNCLIESFVHILGGSSVTPAIEIGEGSYVRSFAVLNAGPPAGFIRIGRKSTIAHQCILHGHGGIVIGDNVMLAGQCMLIASNHIHTDPDLPIIEQGFSAAGICIEDNVWLGAGVKVLDGVTIGTGSIIGAGSVITNDIPPYSVAMGVPAVIKKNRRQIMTDIQQVS